MALTPAARAMRRHLLEMIGLVIALDAITIGIFYAVGMRSRSRRVQLVFTAVWTVLTLLVVLRGMGRVRAARLSRRAEGKGPRA
jgi:predicted membrane protein